MRHRRSVDTRLADGSRVNVVLYPVALNGPVVTIRKFPKEQITMDRLVELEALSEEVAGVLKNWLCPDITYLSAEEQAPVRRHF